MYNRKLDEEASKDAFESMKHSNPDRISLDEYLSDVYDTTSATIASMTDTDLRKVSADHHIPLYVFTGNF